MDEWVSEWVDDPTSLSIHLSIHPSTYPSIHLSIHRFIHPSIHRSIVSSIHPSITSNHHIQPSIHLSIHHIQPSFHPSIHPSITSNQSHSEKQLTYLNPSSSSSSHDGGRYLSLVVTVDVLEWLPEGTQLLLHLFLLPCDFASSMLQISNLLKYLHPSNLTSSSSSSSI